MVGVDVGDDGVDLVNGGTSENRRGIFGDAAERNNELTFNLSIDFTDQEREKEGVNK